MNTPQQFPHEEIKSVAGLPGGELAHLLAGLERQKEELGPIADELIGLLRRLGVGSLPQEASLQVNPSGE